MAEIRNFANIISISRIIAAFGLGLIIPFSQTFFLLYFYCGITDILDGFIARKTHTESKRGALLDSAADVVFVVIAALKLMPMLLPLLPWWSLLLIVIIAIVRILAYIIGAVKFHRFSSLHTVANKITGAALFFTPCLSMYIDIVILSIFVCVIATISALEEILCEIKSKVYNPDIKTVFELCKF